MICNSLYSNVWYWIYLLIYLNFICAGYIIADKNTIHYHFDVPIRVLIDSSKTVDVPNWLLTSKTGYLLIIPKEKKRIVITHNQLTITFRRGKWIVNKRSYAADNIFVVPRDNVATLKCPPDQYGITYNGFLYDGAFALSHINDAVFLVNHVDLEDYVAAVIKSESWPGWPDELNKAFSICFRSYGVSKILEQKYLYKNRKIALPYDIKNSNHHQVYKGCRQTVLFKKIAQQTKHLVLTYNRQPIVAMFDISCGNVIAANVAGLDFKKAPYLARTYSCQYCTNYKLNNWVERYAATEFTNILRQEFSRIGALQKVSIYQKDAAGIVQLITIKTSTRTVTLTAKKFKSLFKRLKSLCFTIQLKHNAVIITGKGFGHLVGLCQRGAHTMVTHGWKARDILKFYYPGTTLMRLTTCTGD